MTQPPKILNTQTLVKTRLFHIQSVDLEFSNGVNVQYQRLKGSSTGAVLVVPMLDDDTVLLIREYAVGVERYELALPKGHIEKDEDMLAAANREIKEEIGYGASKLEHVTSLTLAPGYFNHTTHVILAQELYPQRLPGDEPEAIEVVPWRLSMLMELLERDDITEARSIAALFIIQQRLKHA